MDKTSVLSRCCLWIAVLALALLPVSALGVRLHWFHFRIGLLLFLLSAVLGLLVIVVAAVGTRRQKNNTSRKTLSSAALLSLPPVLFFALNLFAGAGAPMIHDVTTAPDDPPPFIAAKGQRSAADNPVDYDPENAALQRQAWPELVPLHTTLAPQQAFALAQSIAEELDWTIYAADAQSGRIEAVERTRWFGFEDDIVIRIRAADQGSRIDLRSASRVGKGDLGANAKRIERFVRAFAKAAEHP